jgi:hypothetical protein
MRLVNPQMAVPVPSISCCVFNNADFFYQELNELAFNRDTCCHLVICLRLLASHWSFWLLVILFAENIVCYIFSRSFYDLVEPSNGSCGNWQLVILSTGLSSICLVRHSPSWLPVFLPDGHIVRQSF